jgi:hypothetical protein
MNLIELIIWSFTAILSIGMAVGGYNWFGPLGAIGGVVSGVLSGLTVGVSVAKLFYRSSQRRKKFAREHVNQRAALR